ncbi:DUF2165 domain-containing protein [Dokdonella sp.]|uniref:DUF2165 family protein n=1 Tax=Dokdonella sp. TaxID=2291710 RepID=UPI0027B945CE|nr:DUF2165 domain-containing protein [Dokdonella sp.]
MPLLRLSKILTVAAVALYASLVAFGNLTDYGSNLAFVQHVLAMDSVFPDSTTRWRAITDPAVQHLAYALIIASETATALLCWFGAARLWRRRHAPANEFQRAKSVAIGGLTLGFLVWQVGFMTIGGEWFGMWMSTLWNGLETAFRCFMLILVTLVFVAARDEELPPRA